MVAVLAFQGIASASFPDLSQEHVHADAILYVQSQGIVQGYPDGTFRPDKKINRAEFTKVIISSIASEEEISNCNLSALTYFSDVDSKEWYAPYVCIALARGIITGHLRTNAPPYFGAWESINIVGASKILTVGFDIGEPPMDCLSDWGAECIAAARRGEYWYERHLLALDERNAIPLSVTQHTHYVTRGEMSEMIYRLKANVTDKPSRTYEELKK